MFYKKMLFICVVTYILQVIKSLCCSRKHGSIICYATNGQTITSKSVLKRYRLVMEINRVHSFSGSFLARRWPQKVVFISFDVSYSGFYELRMKIRDFHSNAG